VLDAWALAGQVRMHIIHSGLLALLYLRRSSTVSCTHHNHLRFAVVIAPTTLVGAYEWTS